MKRRAIYIPLLVLFMVTLSLTLTSCVGVGGRWEIGASGDYRDLGTGVSSVADAVESFCKDEATTENKCQSVKKMYNEMRQNYLDVADTLRESIISEGDSSYYRTKYQKEISRIMKDIQFIFKSMEG